MYKSIQIYPAFGISGLNIVNKCETHTLNLV